MSWEVGPGVEAENALVLTPDGALEQLPTTRRIVAGAPTIPGWEFHSARPPKAWTCEFSIESERGRTIHIDARRWRYVLFRFPDRTFDIVLEQSNLANVSADERYTAAVVLLDGILGEVERLEWIRGIDPVETLSEEHANKTNPIDVLREHLASLVANP